MVAISLYRGNLHRVPDVPRRWLMPTPKISLKDFKTLLNRRNRALSRLRPTTPNNDTVNPTPNSDSDCKQQPQPPKPSAPPVVVQPQLEDNNNNNNKAGNCQTKEENIKDEEINDRGKSDGGDCSVKQVNESEVVLENKATDAVVDDEKLQSFEVEKPAEPVNPNVQTTEKVEVLDGKEKRKREVEEKLQTLNAKKHNLVQALKQILNAEEELKRRNLMHGMVNRPGGQLQVGATSDPGLMTRHPTPRMGSEAHLGSDNMDGADAEDISNQNANSRHLLRMSSMSPSSESPLRRAAYFQHNVVPHAPRASLGATGSPSRFAPTGHQGNLPAVSVSGTNYIASSPSPAASGGTSVFRDARQPSPWN